MEPLQLFPWSEPDRLVRIGQQIAEFVVVVTLLYLLGRFVVVPAVNWALEARGVEPTLASAMRKASRTGVVVVAVVLAGGFAGFSRLLGGSALLAAAATIALGFAAQGIFVNFIAGVFIVRDPYFNIGDWIEWEDQVGVIDDISFRVTRIRTFANEVVTVPNSQLATNAVTNRMGNETLRISCEFGVEYGADLREVSAILLSVAEEHPHVLDDPSPSVRIADLLGDSIDVQARFWIEDPSRGDYLSVRSEFLQRATERLATADIGVGTTTDLSGEFDVRTGEGSRRDRDGT
ncbi:mechanosensitive ion channel family protein [Halobaculum rarum]|uniref:mechanosensitive ion channel family protein n=1 Tax=Halobaculum rarum TaxID=3075122 RepID=UPI0032AFA2DE